MKMQWKIGQVEMQNPFILAPMAGVTDLPFRLLCKTSVYRDGQREGDFFP